MLKSSENKKSKDTDFDWRYRAVTTVAKDWKNPWTGSLLEKGDVIYAVAEVSFKRGSVSFPVPDTTAMFLNLSYELFEKANNYFGKLHIQKIKKKKQSLGEDANIVCFYESLFASIVFSYAALESFSNHHIPDDYVYIKQDQDGNQIKLSKDEIEREIALAEKILNILPEIFAIKFSKQKQAWHEFKKLEGFRNRVVHIKTRDTKSALKDIDTIWNDLFSENLIKPYKLAYNVIKEFISNTKKVPIPRWYKMYPKKMN